MCMSSAPKLIVRQVMPLQTLGPTNVGVDEARPGTYVWTKGSITLFGSLAPIPMRGRLIGSEDEALASSCPMYVGVTLAPPSLHDGYSRDDCESSHNL